MIELLEKKDNIVEIIDQNHKDKRDIAGAHREPLH